MRMRRGRLKKKTSDDAGGAAPEKPPTRSWRQVALVVACACAAEMTSCRRRVPAPAEFDAMVDWSLALQARAPQMPRKWNEVVYTALEGQDPAHTNSVRGPSQLSGQVVVT